jgi:hypothetical protein
LLHSEHAEEIATVAVHFKFEYQLTPRLPARQYYGLWAFRFTSVWRVSLLVY